MTVELEAVYTILNPRLPALYSILQVKIARHEIAMVGLNA